MKLFVTSPKTPTRKGIARAAKEQRRVSAEARQALYDAMHPHAKLAMIEGRRGISAKETDRVRKSLAQQS